MPVHHERRGRIAVITLDRPAVRNAVDRPTADALLDAFQVFFDDDDADVAVLTGAGGTFCSGADLQAITADPARVNRLEPDGPGPMGISREVSPKPVIAAIEGHAVAGGLELALWCDLRVVAEDAVLGVFCRRWGVPLIDGGTVRLPRLIGQSRALDLILTGRPVAAEEALAIGLANRVSPTGQALATAMALAEDVARFPQACLRADRSSAYAAFDAPLRDALHREFVRGEAALHLEGVHGAQRFAQGAGRGGRFDSES
jgi:enoyl-CoA hydratase